MSIYNVDNIQSVTEYQHNDGVTYCYGVLTKQGVYCNVPPDQYNADNILIQQWIADGGVTTIVNN